MWVRCLLFANKVQIEHAISPSAVMEMLDVRMCFSARDRLCVSPHTIFLLLVLLGGEEGARGKCLV